MAVAAPRVRLSLHLGNGVVSLTMASGVPLFERTPRRALLAAATRRPLPHVCPRAFNSQVSEGREGKRNALTWVPPGVHVGHL